MQQQTVANMDYLGYWQLAERPFENTGNTKFFYYSPGHKEALIRMVYVIKQHKAGALLAGDYGTGKTTIANELMAEINDSRNYRSVYISNPILTSRELLLEIVFQLGVDVSRTSRPILRRAITEKFKRNMREGAQTVLIVDESHLITRRDVLEELRLMMNLQDQDRFLSTIIMLGQLELRDTINAMPQFKQRFAMCYLLRHLDQNGTAGYLEHRLAVAGATRRIFSEEAKDLVFSASSGRPRQINNICDMSLLVGYMRGSGLIEAETIREVVNDLGEKV